MNLLTKLKRFLFLLLKWKYVTRLIHAGAFAEKWYVENYCDSFPHAGFPIYHYIRYGRPLDNKPHPLFDPAWYRAKANLPSGADPLHDYLIRCRQGRHPLPNATLDRIAHLPGGLAFVARFSFKAFPSLDLPRIPSSLAETFDEKIETEFLKSIPALKLRPLVSIIMPTWNRASSLMAAIESVLAQTYASWELLIIDDGSTDSTSAVLAQVYDARVIILHMGHAGAATARNVGLANAKGEFIAYHDSDNRWKPYFLEVMLRFLLDKNLEGAYSAIHYHAPEGSRYIGTPMHIENLSWANFIDLNAFVHSRQLTERLGNFDPRLRRMIDWDLILRYARGTQIAFAPFIGVDYCAGEQPNRISRAESVNWRNVVIGKDRIDWGREQEIANSRSPELISVIIVINDAQDGNAIDACLESIFLDSLTSRKVEVVLVDNQADQAISNRLALWEAFMPSVRRLHNRVPLGISLCLNLGFQASLGACVVFLKNPALLSKRSLVTLCDALATRQAAAAQGMILGPDGAIQNTGFNFPADTQMGSPLYRDFPRDHPAVTTARTVDAASASFLAVDARIFAHTGGFDDFYAAECFDWDFCLRLRENIHPCIYEPAASIQLCAHTTRQHSPNAWDRKLFGERWQNSLPQNTTPYAQSGLFITDYALDALPEGRQNLAIFLPIAYSRCKQIIPPRYHLSIGIFISCPYQEKEKWGDYYFASALAHELEQIGYFAEIVYLDSPRTSIFSVQLVVRGLHAEKPCADALNLLWLISHPSDVEEKELAAFDHVLVASTDYAHKLSGMLGNKVSSLLQCTDPRYFNPHLPPAPENEEMLFVGNSRGVRREAIALCLEAGIQPAIYGSGWEEFVPPQAIKGQLLPNAQVGRHYHSATAVLNDHWPDMAKAGFISNRVFDVLACGGVLITDHVAGMNALFGDAFLTYSDRNSLLEAFQETLNNKEMLRKKALSAANNILREHTFAARACDIDAAIKQLLSQRARNSFQTASTS